MPRINKNAQEDTNDSNLESAVIQNLPSLSITTEPVFICGVNRRTNMGALFEHIDLYAGIALPLPGTGMHDLETLRAMITEAAETGFNITSQETYVRYKLIKEAQKNPRS